ncbi:MAG: GNAT family N-acetyltransferase [Myxococcales bacterium]|nr:GNAT family N-acetyltransferase [Myxococcales bacterium]
MLRPDQSRETSKFAGDEAQGSLHIAATLDGAVVCVGSVHAEGRPSGPDSGFRVRGMATAEGHRGVGLGTRILRGLVCHAAFHGASEVWCNARIGAVSMYAREGFEICSEEFELPGIGPHRQMIRRLATVNPGCAS